MRYFQKDYIPILSNKITECISKLANGQKVEHRIKQRANIILLAAQGKSNKEIANEISMHYNTIGKWRARFIRELPFLEMVTTKRPEILRELIFHTLSDLHREGAPIEITNETRAIIRTMACQKPRDYDIHAQKWTLSFLKQSLIENKYVANISLASIWRILEDSDIKPWKNQYYLHSKEKYEDYAVFKRKIVAINSLYARAKALHGIDDADFAIYSTDEMTGIQALERIFPDKLPLPGQTAKREFEYIRHGTISMIGFFNVVTGKIVEPVYLNDTRTEVDFKNALKQVIDSNPNKEHYYIVCDNLNTHQSESVVLYVADVCGIPRNSLGVKGKSGILKSQQSRTEFLADESHKITFCYVPIHCSWMNQIEVWFGIINQHLLKGGNFSSVEFMISEIRDYISKYNLCFAHPWNWKYNDVPPDPSKIDERSKEKDDGFNIQLIEAI